jgi:hypothetical protein
VLDLAGPLQPQKGAPGAILPFASRLRLSVAA